LKKTYTVGESVTVDGIEGFIQAEAFLFEYRKLNHIYIEASGDGPHTEAIDCALDKLALYQIRSRMQTGK